MLYKLYLGNDDCMHGQALCLVWEVWREKLLIFHPQLSLDETLIKAEQSANGDSPVRYSSNSIRRMAWKWKFLINFLKWHFCTHLSNDNAPRNYRFFCGFLWISRERGALDRPRALFKHINLLTAAERYQSIEWRQTSPSHFMLLCQTSQAHEIICFHCFRPSSKNPSLLFDFLRRLDGLLPVLVVHLCNISNRREAQIPAVRELHRKDPRLGLPTNAPRVERRKHPNLVSEEQQEQLGVLEWRNRSILGT